MSSVNRNSDIEVIMRHKVIYFTTFKNDDYVKTVDGVFCGSIPLFRHNVSVQTLRDEYKTMYSEGICPHYVFYKVGEPEECWFVMTEQQAYDAFTNDSNIKIIP